MSYSIPNVIETTAETFERDAIARSRDVPVVVDFWAGWCQPCRLLAPVLERLVGEYRGRFVLVKAETERLPEVAASFGVRSIPAVFGLRDGRVVDDFVGVPPESAIRSWIDRLLPTPAQSRAAEARMLEPSDPRASESKYREALALEPDEPRARIGLARLLLREGRSDEAGSLVESLERRGFLEPEAEELKAELTLRGRADPTVNVESARAALAANPGDLPIKLAMAKALAAEGQYEEALEIGLDLVERDRKGVGEEARQMMLAIFQLLPDDSSIARDYRRRLSFAL